MPLVKLNIPTLVSDQVIDEQKQFVLRPLFLEYPVVLRRRYDNAILQYQKEVKKIFRGYRLSRPKADQLLWYLFNPELHYQQFELEFNLNRQLVKGAFAAVSFGLQGHTFVCLPGLNNFMFLSSAATSSDLRSECRKHIRKLMSDFQADDPDNFNTQDYLARPQEFIHEVEVTVNIAYQPFEFEEKSPMAFLSSLLEGTEFDGVQEMEKVGQDWNGLYPTELSRAYQQDELVEQLYQLIYHSQETPIALVGPEGVGKHTMVQEAIWRYRSETYGKAKGRQQRIWRVDPTRIIAGMSVVGMWQKRTEAIIRFAINPTENSRGCDKILIDNPIALLRIGKSAQNDMNLSDVLQPYLEQRQFQLILIATPEEWKALQEQGRRFSSLFRLLRIQEPPLSKVIDIILEKRRQLEREQDTSISIKAIEELLSIQRNFLRRKPLPGSVIRLMQQLAVKHRLGYVDSPEVRAEFQAISGMKEQAFANTSPAGAEETARQIGQKLVGQPQAVQALADVAHLVQAKLTNPNKPISSFLFVGPTGVGKTQAAKVLCEHLTGDAQQLVRFDMNEYIDSSGVQRLIGDYYNPEGQLTGAVRYRPFSILLLDEIEKAHPLVHDLLLQVLDDGRLTDSLGRTVDFSNTIIILTSNAGAREAGSQLGFQTDEQAQAHAYRRAMEQTFRPEFINRIDHTVVFNPLQPEHILGIARLQIQELLSRDGFVRRATILNISQEALQWVSHRGFDPRMGGRALKRQIERDLTVLSAEQLLVNPQSEAPIIFEIGLQGQRLSPKVTPLSFVEELSEGWLPHLPEETRGKAFYNQLLRSLEKLRENLSRYEENKEQHTPLVFEDGQPAGGLNWQYYHFKAKVEEAREAIRNISLGFRDKYYKIGPAIPLRLKAVNIVPKSDWSTKGLRENVKDRLFQKEGIQEISDAYQYAKVQFDSLKSEFLNNYLKVALFNLQQQALLQQRPAKTTLRVRSLINDRGQEQALYLLRRYEAFFQMLDLSHQWPEDSPYFTLEAYGIKELLAGETGVHLFYYAHQSPIPIQVAFGDKPTADEPLDVVRVYHGNHTVTDIRSGFSNDFNFTSAELFLMVYAGIPQKVRQAIAPV